MRIDCSFYGTVPMADAGNAGPRPHHRRYGPESYAACYDNLVHWARTADSLGYDTMWFTEHHFQYEGYEVIPNQVLFGLYCATQTERLRFGQMFNVVPQWHPLRLAEDFALADVLSGGRMVFGVGRGTVPREAQTLGAVVASGDNAMSEQADRRNREVFEESMEVILAAFGNERFSYTGKHFEFPPAGIPDRGSTVSALTLVPRPTAPVEVFQAATSPASIDYVARKGFKGVFAGKPLALLRADWERFGEAAATAGRSLRPGEGRALVLNMHIGESHEEAVREGRDGHDEYCKFLSPYGRFRHYTPPPGASSTPFDYQPGLEESIDQRVWAVGSVEEVAETISLYRETLGLEHLCCFFDLPGLTREQLDRQLERFATGVAPLLGLEMPRGDPVTLVEAAQGALRLAGAVDGAGGRLDVDCEGGVVSAVHRGGAAGPPVAGGQEVDCSGMVLLPALAEPHAHVDKSYTADRYPNPTGDLDGAIAATHRVFAEMTAADIAANARRSLAGYLAMGCLAVRTHVAVGPSMGLRSLEGVLAAVAEVAGLLDVQVVAHIAPPVHGAAGREQLALLREAIAMGATHVGGTPYRDEDPVAETHALLEEAAVAELAVDLHTDETLERTCLTVLALAEAVERTRFPFAVAASHCVSLGVQERAVQERAAETLAGAGVAVVSLPQTNLFLQGRCHPVATPRGLTALAPLVAAGVTLAAGGDNVQDAFNPMGRCDPLEAASLLVTAGHLDPAAALGLVTAGARAVMGLPPVAIAPGSPADLVAVPGTGCREAIAQGDPRRVVVRRGAVVSAPADAINPPTRREAERV